MSPTANHPTILIDFNRVLRCRATRRYFTGEGWTDSPNHAQPFPNDEEAVRACTLHKLNDVELVHLAPTDGTVLKVIAIP